MTINHLKKKKYQILISLFCLCYALGTQEIKASSTREAMEGNLMITTSSKGKKYNMDSYTNIKPVEFDSRKVNIDIFTGTTTGTDSENNEQISREDIFIITKKTKADNNTTADVQGYQFRNLPLDDNNSDAFYAFYDKREQSYILQLIDSSDSSHTLYLYYNSVTKEFIQVTYARSNSLFFQAMSPTETTNDSKSDSDSKIKIWEIKKKKNIMISWELNKDDIKTLNKETLPSSNWFIGHTLKLGNSSIPYFKADPISLGITIFAIVAIVCCALFHKDIEKTLKKWRK